MPKVNTYLAFDGTAAEAILALQPSFFAETFSTLIDRFGTPWTVSGGTRQG